MRTNFIYTYIKYHIVPEIIFILGFKYYTFNSTPLKTHEVPFINYGYAYLVLIHTSFIHLV